MHLVRHHESRVEAQAEMTDHIVLCRLILIFLQELGSAGESDLGDILLHLVRRHAKSVIDELQRLILRIHNYLDRRFIIIGKLILSHHIQLLQLSDGVAAVGDHLPHENVMIRIYPLLDNRENILAADGQITFFCCHFYHS